MIKGFDLNDTRISLEVVAMKWKLMIVFQHDYKGKSFPDIGDPVYRDEDILIRFVEADSEKQAIENGKVLLATERYTNYEEGVAIAVSPDVSDNEGVRRLRELQLRHITT